MSISHTDNQTSAHDSTAGCNAERDGCHSCSGEVKHAVAGLAGWAFAAGAAGAFLFPLAAALVGIGLAGNSQGRQLLGALAGLVAGALTAFIFAKAVAASSKHRAYGQSGE